jgi:hypothetical protein
MMFMKKLSGSQSGLMTIRQGAAQTDEELIAEKILWRRT